MKQNTGMSEQARTTVGALLDALLADEVALYVATRGAHWNVVGMNFAALHKFFEEQYEALDEVADEIAERVRALGLRATATVGAYAKVKRIDDQAGTAPSAAQMIESLLSAHETMIRQLRADAQTAAEQGDEGTADFLLGLMELHEKTAWMLRAHRQSEAR